MVGADLEQLLVGSFPAATRRTSCGTRRARLRQAAVGDLLDQHVLEPVRRFAGDRRAGLARDEVAQQRVVEHVFELVGVVLRREVVDRAGPEDAADHGAALQDHLLARRQPVDARADQRLQRIGNAVAAVPALLQQHADGLLDEQRIALGLVEQPRLDLRETSCSRQQCVGELLALAHARAARARSRSSARGRRPSRAARRATRAGRDRDAAAALAHPLREVVDQLEQRLLRPVDVLEHHDQRLDVGELVGELARRPGDLRRAALPFDRLHHAGREPEQLGDRLVPAALDQLLLGRLHRVVVRDPCSRLDHLGERPVRDALAVRKRAPGEDGRALDPRKELACEPALPHARLAVDREEVRPPVAQSARVGVLQQVELGLRGR